jgi:hypothetical protein
MSRDEKFESVAEAARRILDAYGHAAPDTAAIVYADGDLSINGETDLIEIIYRGTLVLRSAPENVSANHVFHDEGEWMEVVERIAKNIPAPPSSEDEA